MVRRIPCRVPWCILARGNRSSPVNTRYAKHRFRLSKTVTVHRWIGNTSARSASECNGALVIPARMRWPTLPLHGFLASKHPRVGPHLLFGIYFITYTRAEGLEDVLRERLSVIFSFHIIFSPFCLIPLESPCPLAPSSPLE